MLCRIILAFLLLVVSTGSAVAQKDSSSSKGSEAVQSKSSSGTTKAASTVPLAAAGKFVANGTKRLAALTAGFVIGMPIAAVRMTVHADGEHAKAVPILGESSIEPLTWFSRALVIPSAVFSGVVQAPVYNATNAWRESGENPFSKESIFLGNYDDRVAQP